MIYKMLEIGTCNLTEKTVDMLANNEIKDLVVYPKTLADDGHTYGYFLYVPDVEAFEEMRGNLPEDISSVLTYAMDRRCAWIMIDPDAVNRNMTIYEQQSTTPTCG